MTFDNSQTLNFMNTVSAALDAQQAAGDQFRTTISALASEIEALAAGAAQYGKGLDYAYEEAVSLGDECRGFANASAVESFS